MSKVYKIKERLVVNLPFDMIKALGIKDGDEVDFFSYSGKEFLVAKKSDILSMLTGQQQQAAQRPPSAIPQISISEPELSVLRKLDTVRYSNRTKETLTKLLTADEKKIIRELIRKKYVNKFQKPGEQQVKYGIAKSIYDAYIFGKRERARVAQPQQQAQQAQQPQMQSARSSAVAQVVEPKRWEQKIANDNSYFNMLEAAGYLVVPTQAEASSVSAALEESIRRGLVVGTRGFNKKYYIVLKAFVNRNAQKIIKAIGQKGATVESIVKETGVEEDGVLSILYMLAEGGEVTESKRDFFKLVS